MKVLFVCTANRLRSPTAEAVFAGHPGLEVRSGGLDGACPRPLTDELVAWADRLFVMEQRHREKIRKRFRQALGDKPIVVLGIPDDYEFMQPELVALLKERVPSFLD
ncbi:protein tyrosine phosphatase [Sinorhizobium meliloti]|uniref:low molecular weight protein tyrosine phosphatase family protein n=1 Tax=Rhizobium meliloti TaxID=382 RepID=UPI00299DA062|nr:protein tyrosine phosphatase [Sinorhizobium meliloti]